MPCASSDDDPWLDLLGIALAAWAVLVRAVRCTGILPAQQNIRLPKRYESAPAHNIKGVTTEDTHNRRFLAMAVAQDVNGFPSKRKEKRAQD